MRIVSVNELAKDMVLAREVIDLETGRVLLGKGTPVLPQYSERLQKSNINYLYVEDPPSDGDGIEIVPEICDEIRSQAEDSLQKIFLRLQLSQEPEYRSAMQITQELIREVLAKREIMINVYELRNKGGDFIGHSVNVAFLSLLMGNNLQYDDEKLRNLGTGALLHDIGMTGLPAELVNKTHGFSPEEQLLYEQHPVIGYHAVKDSWEISPLARGVVLAHHERSDGSGYPRRLLKGDIHEFARIVGLADCFEELTGGHPFSRQLKIQEAVELLEAKAECWFESEWVQAFTNRILLCPTGTTVRLNDGSVAIVLAQNKGFPTRPVVRIFLDAAGRELKAGPEIDLMENNHLLIQ